ncbi:Prefoldin subunit-domain-containing protein [Phakopsora pachyrhizi]|uniref:Prefoldin subunit 3 n=1 Tax=Phakopsora pachyrhizi TaxID=170000 RepID=A0AAV0BK49_PHAPC|nr:Prefoldin subunit-domain-containing protein [Phakopsora pachyrhizi]
MATRLSLVSTTNTGPRGIAEAIFIRDVEAHIGGPDVDIEPVLKAWQELIAKYQFMEKSTLQKKSGLEEKIPELKRSLEAVEILKAKKEENESLETHYELADTVYTRAIIEPVDEVYLWLGASTMIAYSLSEAYELLTSKIESAKTRLSETIEEQAYLRNQITTSQVNIARVYNWGVKRRKELKLKKEDGDQDTSLVK